MLEKRVKHDSYFMVDTVRLEICDSKKCPGTRWIWHSASLWSSSVTFIWNRRQLRLERGRVHQL